MSCSVYWREALIRERHLFSCGFEMVRRSLEGVEGGMQNARDWKRKLLSIIISQSYLESFVHRKNRSSRLQMFAKIGVLKHFAIFSGATLLKRDSNTGVSPWILQIWTDFLGREENRVLELLVLILSIVGRKSIDKIKSWLIYGFFSFIKVTKGNAMKFINFTSI